MHCKKGGIFFLKKYHGKSNVSDEKPKCKMKRKKISV